MEVLSRNNKDEHNNRIIGPSADDFCSDGSDHLCSIFCTRFVRHVSSVFLSLHLKVLCYYYYHYYLHVCVITSYIK